VKQKTAAQLNTEKTAAAARALTRRSVLGCAVASVALAAGPFVVSRRALASSGELDILMWSDYLPPDLIADFENATGIKVNHTGIGSNEEIIAKLKASAGRGFDICSPTSMRSLQWVELELLQPFDISRIKNLNNVNPAMLRVGDTDWNFGDRGAHWLPHIWGTEAIAWRTDAWQPKDGPDTLPSYGDIWDPAVAGKTMMRPHSGMLGAGLHLETTGVLEPGDMRRAYESEDAMRPIWEKVTKFCIDNRAQVNLFWNDADSQKNGFLTEGVVVGQTWDGPPIAMKNAGEPIMYRAPIEGALAWIDGMAIPVGAENIDQLYAFIDYAFSPEPAGKAIDTHGYNSAVLGADIFASDTYAKNFGDAYPGDSLANLWPWPKEAQWYADLRTEYRDKFVGA
jgi:spermidine/putrescine transport system substrate-binding protein